MGGGTQVNRPATIRPALLREPGPKRDPAINPRTYRGMRIDARCQPPVSIGIDEPACVGSRMRERLTAHDRRLDVAAGAPAFAGKSPAQSWKATTETTRVNPSKW